MKCALPDRILVAFVIATVLVLPGLAQPQNRDEDRETAPRFHARTLEGEQFTNDSTKGKVVLLQFWTT